MADVVARCVFSDDSACGDERPSFSKPELAFTVDVLPCPRLWFHGFALSFARRAYVLGLGGRDSVFIQDLYQLATCLRNAKAWVSPSSGLLHCTDADCVMFGLAARPILFFLDTFR